MFLFMVLALIVMVAIASAPATRKAVAKAKTYLSGTKYLLLSNDLPKKFSGSNYLRIRDAPSTSSKRVLRIVFVRHGQSVWNAIFNSFGVSWPVRAVKYLIGEVLLFFTNPLDSYIIDSPLSPKGVKEAEELQMYVRSAKGKISMDTSKSLIVCSNLRRAMATALIGLQPRLSLTREKIVMMSALQEGSRNIDAQSFSTMKGKIAATPVHNLDTAVLLHSAFDPSFNEGNKSLKSNVYQRMDDFVSCVFSPTIGLAPPAASTTGNYALEELIVVGHSGWFRCFFKRFLPAASQHVSKTKKMKNCGAVAFNLIRDEATNEVYIDEASIEILSKGFA